MLNLGHSHPDFTYANDERSVKLTLLLLAMMSIVIVAMIVAGVFAA